jgi:hypothetical protein
LLRKYTTCFLSAKLFLHLLYASPHSHSRFCLYRCAFGSLDGWEAEMKRVFHIDVKYACYGIVSVNDIVTESAPIANWMIGKTLQQIKPFLICKQAKVIEI